MSASQEPDRDCAESRDGPGAGFRLTRRRVGLVAGAAVAAGVGASVLVRVAEDPGPEPPPEHPEDHGPTGTADDSSAIQAAIDAAARHAGTVALSRSHALGRSIHARDGVTLQLGPGARLRRTYSGHALIRNEDLSAKVKRFRIVGPGTLGAFDHSLPGQAVFLFGDEIELSGFTIDTYAGGQALLIGGDHNRLEHLRILNPEPTFGVGGIRMFGGTDFRATSCDVVAGDDALQFTPIAEPGHPLRDLPVSDSAFVDCTGGSLAARFAVAILSTSPPGGRTLTASISRVSFTGCHGFAYRRGLVVSNTDSTGEIGDVLLECDVDMRGSAADPRAEEVLIARGDGAGRVHDIRLHDVRIRNPAATTFATNGHAATGSVVEDVVLDECMLEPPANGDSTIKAFAVVGLTVRGGKIEGTGTADVVTGGVGDRASQDVRFTETAVTGIGAGRAGVRLPETTGYVVRDCSFEPAPGAIDATGVAVGRTSTNGVVVGNDFSRLPGPGVTGPVADAVVPDNSDGEHAAVTAERVTFPAPAAGRAPAAHLRGSGDPTAPGGA